MIFQRKNSDFSGALQLRASVCGEWFHSRLEALFSASFRAKKICERMEGFGDRRVSKSVDSVLCLFQYGTCHEKLFW